MTAITPKQTDPGRGPVPAQPPGAPPPKLRRRGWVPLVGVVAAGFGAAAGLVTWVAMSTSQEVVVAAADLDKYQVIGPDDVRTVAVSLDPSVASIPGADADSLVGQRLAGPVPEGGILAPAGVSDDPFPPQGKSVVRVALTAQQANGLTLEPGDTVRVVVSAPTAATDTEPTYSPGEVSGVHLADTGAVVDVLVAHTEAVALSDAVVGGRTSIVEDFVLPSADKGGE